MASQTEETGQGSPIDAHLTAAEVRASFESVTPGTLGIEEELMLLDPETLALAPRAREALARCHGDPRFKLELPASQLEIVLGPFADVGRLERELRGARAELARSLDGLVRPAAAAVHPFSPGVGALNAGEHYERTADRYGAIAERQLVCAFQVHVAVGGAARTLAVYNALRSYLPLLAALAANAPFYEGRDTGLASIRPVLCRLLPRQGVPPALESWDAYVAHLAWGARAGAFPDPRGWWWELRPHPRYGTLELRVPDAQVTVGDAVAVAAAAHSLVLWLGRRFDAGERLAVHETWRIEENRWSASRHGVAGEMADLDTGAPRSTAEWLLELLEELDAPAASAGAETALSHVRGLVEAGGHVRQRRVAADEGTAAVARWLADRFVDAARAGVPGH